MGCWLVKYFDAECCRARTLHLMVASCEPDRSSLSSGLSARQRTGAEWDASRRRSRPLPTLHTLISLSSGPVEPVWQA